MWKKKRKRKSFHSKNNDNMNKCMNRTDCLRYDIISDSAGDRKNNKLKNKSTKEQKKRLLSIN